MAGEIENEDDDVLELGEAPETQEAAEGNDTLDGAEDDDVEIPTFGDPGDEEDDDHPTLRKVRAVLRETQRELAEAKKANQPEPEIVIGDKPTLESCEYDEEKFEAELTGWHDRKRQAEAKANTLSEVQQKQNEIWQARATDFAQKRAAYPPSIMNECEAALAATLSKEQRFAIIRYAKNPAAFTLALGRSQSKLDALAKIDDIGEFIAETALLEKEVKMAKRKPAAQVERIVQGSASMVANTDAHLAKLEKEAARTGDRTKIAAYKRDQRKKVA